MYCREFLLSFSFKGGTCHSELFFSLARVVEMFVVRGGPPFAPAERRRETPRMPASMTNCLFLLSSTSYGFFSF